VHTDFIDMSSTRAERHFVEHVPLERYGRSIGVDGPTAHAVNREGPPNKEALRQRSGARPQ